ncbi:MAG: Fe-S-containing hydro-lyase [Victivallales bacterium]|nr:Fe-S-containing hydro-lyase [Victivallales bacterium]
MNVKLTTPFSEDTMKKLHAGDQVLLSGIIYTGRDAAHKRLCDLLNAGKELPVDLCGQVIYFVGPTPARPGKVIGSAGPTTSYRMDAYSPRLIAEAGLRGMIGKGDRSPEVITAMRHCGCVYFAATGGAAALISKSIVSCEVVCYEDLGPEAIHRLEVRDMPLIVAIDAYGKNLYTDK